MIRLSDAVDLTTKEGLELGLSSVRGDSKTLSRVSIPCIGGSVLQYAHRHHPGAARRMAKHLKLFRKLWRRSVTLIEAVLGAEGNVAIEWPASCSFRRSREVRAIIKRQYLQNVKIHGCALGAVGES